MVEAVFHYALLSGGSVMGTFEGITWLALLNVVAIDLVLSGDNALVIGMAVRKLPPALAKRAAVAGAALAVGLRVVFTGLAALLLAVPLLQAVGGALLLHLAAKLAGGQADDDDAPSSAAIGFWPAVQAIVVADVVMSLDNVLAVGGAAHGNLLLMGLGLALSIPLVLGGSALVTQALHRWPVLNLLGAAILAGTAGQMIAHDALVTGWLAAAGLAALVPAAPALAAAAVAGVVVARRRVAAEVA